MKSHWKLRVAMLLVLTFMAALAIQTVSTADIPPPAQPTDGEDTGDGSGDGTPDTTGGGSGDGSETPSCDWGWLLKVLCMIIVWIWMLISGGCG